MESDALSELFLWSPSAATVRTPHGPLTHAAWCEREAARLNRIPGRVAEVRREMRGAVEWCAVFADCVEVAP